MEIPSTTKHPASPAIYEKLFACSPDAIIVVDHEGTLVDVNPQVEALFGYARSDLLGNSVEILIPERFRSAHASHRADYVHHPRMRPMGTGFELHGRRKDGTEFPADVMLSPVEWDGGQGVLGVIRDITERKRLEDAMRQLVLTDALTGLGNYRRLEEAFETEARWFQRADRTFTLVSFDLDGLKKINDTYGHVIGSRALCRVANALRSECRAVDIAIRHGGDEFAVVLPDTNADGAERFACRVANRLANDKEEPTLSISYGVAAYPGDGRQLPQLLAAADRPLYKMKRAKN